MQTLNFFKKVEQKLWKRKKLTDIKKEFQGLLL